MECTAKKRKTRNILTLPGRDGKDFVIDEDDYGVLREIILHQEKTRERLGDDYDLTDYIYISDEDSVTHFSEISDDDEYEDFALDEACYSHEARKMAETDGRDQYRVHKLQVIDSWHSSYLTDSIGNLDHLRFLEIDFVWLRRLPPSIGKLQNLKEFVLRQVSCRELPREIGNLSSLERLELDHVRVRSLPSSIKRLQNLKELVLIRNHKLKMIPEEIGRISGLSVLVIEDTYLERFPRFIGRLKNLKKLRLNANNFLDLPKSIGQLQNLHSLSGDFENLPTEIGNLCRLEELNVKYSNILTLPSSIGQLRNLKDLNLSRAKKLSTLPDEIQTLTSLETLCLKHSNISSLPVTICNLRKLKNLDLSYSEIKSLPSSMGQLQSLECLGMVSTKQLATLPGEIANLKGLKTLYADDKAIKLLHGSLCSSKPDLNQSDPNDFLFNVVKSFPFLGFIEVEMSRILGKLSKKNKQKLDFALGCNRARYRIGLTSTSTTGKTTQNAWPLLLSNAERAFAKYANAPDNTWWGYDQYMEECRVEKHDAIYHFLTNGVESFLIGGAQDHS